MRVLFKGQNYIVVLADEREVAKAQSKGLFIQRNGELKLLYPKEAPLSVR